MLITHFTINESEFCWNTPLEQLDGDFKMLSYLVYLEQLLYSEFKTKMFVIEKINTSIHTPKDIVELIEKALKNPKHYP